MDIKKAIKVLDNHQKWRLGDDDIIQTNASELTESISLILSEVKKLHLPVVNASFLPKCTRVEVIDNSGRAYVNWKPTNKVQTQMQDDDKTLKVFIT